MVFGGKIGTTGVNDVHTSSDNGNTWTEVRATHVSSDWSARAGHSAVVLTSGSVVLVGGGVPENNDVWSLAATEDGSTWQRVLASAPWVARRGFGLVATKRDVLVLFGGYISATEPRQAADVWQSENGGATWARIGDAAPFGRRAYFATVVLSSGAIVVMGGHSSTEEGVTTYYNDVWRSGDGGYGWTQVTAAAAWGARTHVPAVALPDDSIALVSGGGLSADCWRSRDGGATWVPLTPTAQNSWVGRAAHSLVAIGYTVVMIGGRDAGDDKLNEVWRLDLGAAGWADASCASTKRALCSAAAQPTPVSVSLPAAAGVVSPPTAATAAPGVVTFAPMVPVVAAAASQGDTTADNALRYAVTFPAAVTGLVAGDFVVGAGGLVVSSTVLAGSGTAWELTVSVGGGVYGGCPRGFTRGAASSGATVCGRAVEDVGSWALSSSRCAPHSLAVSISSAADLAFAAGLRGSVFEEYW